MLNKVNLWPHFMLIMRFAAYNNVNNIPLTKFLKDEGIENR
jgi:hypothetical protein